MVFFIFILIAVAIYQAFLGYGTAYRLTKMGADSGTALFLWLTAMTLAALVPGLGFYLWSKYRNIDVPEDKFAAEAGVVSKAANPGIGGGLFKMKKSSKDKKQQSAPKTVTCSKCGREYDAFFKVCSGCGFRDLDKRNI